MFFSVVFCYSLLFINCVYTQEKDQACIIQNTGGPGICKLAADCRFAIEQAENGITPPRCGLYMRRYPLFCCPVNNNIQPNENSLLFPEDSLIFENENPNSPQYTRTCERKCTEYSKPLSVTIQATPLITDPIDHITSINVANCTNDGIPLITGGTVAEAGEFPFMAAIGYIGDEGQIEWKCGGTLISEYFVLTAAHCTYTKDAGEPVRIRLGDLDLEKNAGEVQYYEYNVVEIIKHERYQPPSTYNDIALLRVSAEITFSDYVRPACLWTKSRIDQNITIATGLGRIDFTGEASRKLLKVSLFVYNNNQCSKSYKNDWKRLPHGIQSSMLCAGDLRGGKDTCQGDSGGPLLTTKKDNSCLFYVVGITSFGKACGIINTPAIYTRVSEYIPWIERIVWPN